MGLVLITVNYVLTIAFYIIMIQVVLSWLFAFNVINQHNEFMRQLVRGLDGVTEPVYRPIRRILPDFGGLDFAPLVVLLIIGLLQRLIAYEAFSLGAV